MTTAHPFSKQSAPCIPNIDELKQINFQLSFYRNANRALKMNHRFYMKGKYDTIFVWLFGHGKKLAMIYRCGKVALSSYDSYLIGIMMLIIIDKKRDGSRTLKLMISAKW